MNPIPCRIALFAALWLVLPFLNGCVANPSVAVTPSPAPIATVVATFTPTPQPAINSDGAPPLAVTATVTTTNPVAILPTITPAPPITLFDPAQTRLALRPVVEGLNSPLLLTHAGDGSGRMFIVEQTGAIRVLADGALLATPLLDLSAQITTTGNEQGLLGLAFPPNYAETGHFFVNYTDRAGDTLIARYQVLPGNPNQADPNSAVPVLTLTQPARNHNGGMLLFGPDGYLWVGTGDGGGGNDSFGNGQNPRTLLGKMLRLDVTTDPSQPYLIPSDNPWVATDWNGVDVRDEIWAVGLRNPWRYSFDRLTGDLWIGDVGQNRYEEINLVLDNSPGRLNFGWPQMEGQHCTGGSECAQAQFELPVFEYQHSSGCSVTGGYVYRGSQFPALVGVYFFGDYCSGRLWGGWQDEQGQWAMAELLQTDAAISSFGEDEAGELYLTDLRNGRILQLVVDE